MKNIISKIDRADIFSLFGLAILGTGLWWREPWLSLVVVGAILTVLGFLGSLPPSRGK